MGWPQPVRSLVREDQHPLCSRLGPQVAGESAKFVSGEMFARRGSNRQRRSAEGGSRRPRKVVPAVDGLQPGVGHEVLWVIRDVLGGEVLPARSLLSARNQDPAASLTQVTSGGVPVAVRVISDGQHSIRKAVACGCSPACPTGCASSTTRGGR